MIDFTKPHNWIGLFVVVLVVGFVLTQGAKRFQPAAQVARSAGFNA